MSNIIKNFLSFTFFKGIVFFSVLLFSYLDYTKEYIQLEQAIAIATMITPFLVFGLTVSFSHYKVTKETSEFDWIYWRHLKYIICFLSIISVSVTVFFSASEWQLTVILLTLFVFSRFYSQSFKIQNNIFHSSLIDSTPYVLIGICLVLVSVGFELIFAFNIVFYIALLFMFFVVDKSSKSLVYIDKGKVLEFYTFGSKAFLVSAIIVAVMMLPRAFVHLIIHERDIEGFLLALRYASISVLFYQFISIKCFSYIYKLEDKYVLIGVIIIYFVAFFLITIGLNFLYYINFITTVKLNYLVALITALWITSSFLEYFVSKANNAALFTKSCLLFFVPISVLFSIVDELVYAQYLIVLSLVSIVISQLIAVFYYKATYAIFSISIITCSLLIFGFFYV